MDARSAAMAAEVDAAPVDGSAASDGRVKGRSSNRDCNDPGVASNSSVDLRSSNLATRRLEGPDDDVRVSLAAFTGRRGAVDAPGSDARARGGSQVPPVEDAAKVARAGALRLIPRGCGRRRVDVAAGRARYRAGSTTRGRSTRHARRRDGRRWHSAHDTRRAGAASSERVWALVITN